MAELFASGRMIEAILLLVLLEGLALGLLALRGRRAAAGFLPTLAAGFFLLLALWASLTDRPWTWMAAFLALSFAAHILDLALRLRRG